jgi:hydroxylamine dehydrogenase
MKRLHLALLAAIVLMALPAIARAESKCIECHKKVTPGIVEQHLDGKMSKKGVDCATCHGTDHKTAKDYAKAKMPTPKPARAAMPSR